MFAKVATTKTQKQRAASAKRREHRAKLAARLRDFYTCRRCDGAMLQGMLMRHLEAAHLVNSGMGGQPSVGCERKHFVTLCARCHHDVIHAQRERMVYDPGKMGDGPVTFTPVVAKTIGARA